MFTGIIEATGIIESATWEQQNVIYWISSPLSDQFRIDQSVSHNGVCLTIDQLKPGQHRVTAVDETLKKTDLGQWKQGDRVNIERSMLMNGRLDGHIVQGHVDTVAECVSREDRAGSWVYRFRIAGDFATLIIEKGSICLNGISLTIFDISDTEFSVAIIPYTFEFTNLQNIVAGHTVNIEFDMVGKYINRIHSLRS
ncbi:MAG: riboflavin synthase [Chitinophagaceae bacterium]|nr:MAG: riboflavin synthase [Chitinophagaceae bacterium]